MKNFYKILNGFKPNHLVFDTPPTPEFPESQEPEKSPAERQAETIKEIDAEASRNRQAIQDSKLSETTLDTDESDKNHLLKEDTYILIGQKGEGSKNNIAGWQGLATTTDDVKILDYHIRTINKKDYVKVQLKHKLYSKPGTKEKYRTYVGYIEKSKFKDSEQLQRLRKDATELYNRTKNLIADIKEYDKKEPINDFFKKLNTIASVNHLSTSKSQNGDSYKMDVSTSTADHTTGQGIVLSIEANLVDTNQYVYIVDGQRTMNPNDALRLARETIDRHLGKNIINSLYRKIKTIAKEKGLSTSKIVNPNNLTHQIDVIGTGLVKDILTIRIDFLKGRLEFEVDGQHTLNPDDALRLAKETIDRKTEN